MTMPLPSSPHEQRSSFAPLTLDAPPSLGKRLIFQALPLLAILALVALVGALIWIVQKSDAEQDRLELIRDSLWVSEALDFTAQTQQETFVRLSNDIALGRVSISAFHTQARQLFTAYPNLVDLTLGDENGAPRASFPEHTTPHESITLIEPERLREAQEKVISTNQPVQIGPLKLTKQGFAIASILPVTLDGKVIGTLSALLSLDSMLSHDIPWWVAEKRHVALVDAEGLTIAARSRLPTSAQAPEHTMAFGPGNLGVFLRLTSREKQSNRLQTLLVAAILGLGAVAGAGLWARNRHMNRRFEAEQHLREAHSFRMAMEDSIQLGMRARDREGRTISVNPAFCNMMGWKAEELLGKSPPMPYWTEEDEERIRTLNDAVLAGRPPDTGTELVFQKSDGTRFQALVYEAPLINAKGEHLGWIGTFIDITEQKQAQALIEEQRDTLERTARLVTIGEMASLFAHELNQPLATITSYNTGLLNRIRAGVLDEKEISSALEKSGDAAQRAGRIIRRVQDFVKKSDPKFEAFDLSQLAQETLDFFRRQSTTSPAEYGGTLLLDMSAPIPPVSGDRVLLEQVLVNLVRNALEALVNLAPQEREIAIHLTPDGDRVRIEISDNGPGLDEDVRSRLLTPFVTTKAKGMGLGLTICRSILEIHHGTLEYARAPNGGALFRFYLPVA